MKRPAGMIILGVLCLFTGCSGLFEVFSDKPLLFCGILHTESNARLLRMILNMLRIYLGCGLLFPFRSAWYVYLGGTSIGILALSLNIVQESKIWELYLLLQANTPAIPRLVRFTLETHYLLMMLYILTGFYVYGNKHYFWE